MSPRGPLATGSNRGFPRVSGDEPRVELALAAYNAFSPRERG